jgi:hypothetical protein
MFCAKCGTELTVGERGNFVCSRGLEFSSHLSDLFRERYTSVAHDAVVATAPAASARSFCPGCGVPVKSLEQPCLACGGSLTRPMMFQLIEFHPHPDGHGSFF